MIATILNNEELSTFLKDHVQENNASVTLDEDFYLQDGTLNRELLINIAVDEYYNSLNMGITPPSIDNLLVIDRGNKKFSLYLIELKDVKRLRTLCSKNIKAKFETTIDDFMSDRFKKEFHKEGIKITDLNIWLVCNKFNFMGKEISDEDYEKKIRNSLIEKLLLIPPFRFRGKVSAIQAVQNKTETC